MIYITLFCQPTRRAFYQYLDQSVIAWQMLTHNRSRCVWSCLGVAFAVVIMFMEMGFFNGINDSQANLALVLDADLVMENKRKNNLKESDRFTIKRLVQALSHDAVASVIPVYTQGTYWWNPQNGSRNYVLVIGISLDNPGLAIPEIEQYKDQLRLPDTVLYDRQARRDLGEIDIGTRTQLSQTLVTVVGFFTLGSNFTYEGHIIVSHDNYYRMFPTPNSDRVVDRISLGLLTLKPGAEPEAVKAALHQELPDDFRVRTVTEIAQREKAHTIRKSPSGIVFGIGLIVGFVIGVIICYQILFNEIQDNLAQFAILKAIGHHRIYVLGIVASEAVQLSVLGFLPGLAFSWGLYRMIEAYTQILMFLTPARVILVFALTTGMCLLAASLAAYKAIQADPAELY